MVRLIILCLSLAAVEARAAVYYVDYLTGSDANSGTRSSPWKFSPYMVGSSHTLAPGDTVIFRGNTTWPRPCFQMRIQASNVKFGTDQSWFNGGAWSRPVFDFENTLIPGGNENAAGVITYVQHDIVFDGLEMKRHFKPQSGGTLNTWGVCTLALWASDRITVTNCYFHDWALPTPCAPGNDGGGGGAIYSLNDQGHGSGYVVTHCFFDQANTPAKNGTCLYLGGLIEYNSCHDCMSFGLTGGTLRYNHIYNMQFPSDANAHANAIFTFAPSTIYGNLIHDFVNGGCQPIYTAPAYSGSGTDLIYNNVLWNAGDNAPISITTEGAFKPCANNFTRIFNNTLVGGNGYCIKIGDKGFAPWGGITATNNHFITTSSPICTGNPSQNCAAVNTLAVGNNLQQTPAQANAQGYTVTSHYSPTSSSGSTVRAGVNLASIFATDIDGNTRPSTWDIGAYQFNGATPPPPDPGTLFLAMGAQSVGEADGHVTVVARRSPNGVGTVSALYATHDGTAHAGVNYTTTTGTFSWSTFDVSDKSVDIPIINASTFGNPTFTFTLSGATGGATLAAPTTNTVTINGDGSPPPPPSVLLPGLSWDAVIGQVSSPFATNVGGYVSQAIETGDPSTAGIDSFTFTNVAGVYKVKIAATSPSDSANSLFVNFNAMPLSPTNIWDMPTNVVVTTNYVGQRAGGTFDANQFPVFAWDLPAGTNQLFVLGREAGVRVYHVEVEQVVSTNPTNPPASTPPAVVVAVTSVPNGYYRAGTNIPVTVAFSQAVTVTGTPQLSLNTATVNYSSGSGSSNLVFNYLVASGQNTANLEYTGTNALTLNGGTIMNAGTNADLTLFVPGAPGSLSYGRSVVIDTIAPTILIGLPAVVTLTNSIVSVQYPVTYTDLHFSNSTLRTNDLVVTFTGTASATPYISALPGPNVVVGFTGFNGSGSFTFSIGAGTAVDLAGNLAPATGPALPVALSSFTSINNAVLHNVIIH